MGHNNHTPSPWQQVRMEREATARFHRDLARIRLEVEDLERSMFASLVRQYGADRGFLRALTRFSGHTPYGWRVACGPDIRIARLADILGWPQLQRLIQAIRRKEGLV